MSAPGPQDPTIDYLVHRGALIGLVLVIVLCTGYLVFQVAPGLQQWVLSAIDAVHDEWTSWGWELL